MKRKGWFKVGLGAGAVAFVASAGLLIASPTLAQGVNALGPAALAAHGGPGFGHGADTAVIATALSMTEAELRAELQAGKSIADVASAKGVSLDTVVNAVVAEQMTALTQAVTDGRITQAQADTVIANLKATLPGRLQVKHIAGLGGFGRGAGSHGIKGSATLSTTAAALKMTETELRTELQAGKSVADVASAKGVSLDTVVNAIVAEQTTKLMQAVTDGRITQAQADEKIAQLRATLPTTLAQAGNLSGPGRGPGRGGPGRGAPGTAPNPNATPAAEA